MFDILAACKERFEYARGIRRYLHENPELPGREFGTIRLILSELQKLGIPHEEIRDGGVLAYIDGEKPGKTVLLRADCDALPIQESPNNMKKPKCCVSKVEGVSHMCGHDSHTAMLLAAGDVLNHHKDEIEGKVILMFERGEEGPGNIYYLLKHMREHDVRPDSCIAMHIEGEEKAGVVRVTGGGPMAAGVMNFIVELKGTGGHGGRPDLGNNPIDCFVSIAGALKDIRMKYIAPLNGLTYALGVLEGGQACATMPDVIRFGGTARAYDGAAARKFKEKLIEAVECNAKFYECEYSFPTLTGPGLPIINDPDLSALAAKAITEVIGAKYVTKNHATMVSDTFSLLLAYCPGMMLKIGVANEEEGICAPGHNPFFDIDETFMINGIACNVAYALAFLKSDVKPDFTPYGGTVDELFAMASQIVPARVTEEHEA